SVMKSYGQFCPVAKAAEVFCERWTPLILRDLAGGAMRFSQLQRGISLASPTLLSRRLKQLEAEGVVERRRSESGRSWTYHLTPAGEEFAPIIEALGLWGQRWTRRELAEHEVDLGLLLWAMEAGARPDAFDNRRALVQMELTDQPESTRHWWFLNEGGRCELCVKEPDLDVELYLVSTLRDMIYIWRGDLSLGKAMESERLVVHGIAQARRALPRWLGVCALMHVESQRAS
ncbi:MAG: helix-turn-helix transcriptional regulator, partial [Nitrococcus sp.]|nr:helix-turn-helix transcriptional regulator [Nitrococcus sp.]